MLSICHKTQVQLSRQYQQNTLAHAIIIQGIEGSGKHDLAQWLLDLLICQSPMLIAIDDRKTTIKQACGHCKSCLLRKNGSYPDHLSFNDDDKTLGIDDIRRGNGFLETKPHIGTLKTLLIPNAKNMTVASSNALLKTLEEPNANSYIVLIANTLDGLLPTIISRCAVYSIRANTGNALLAELGVSTPHSSDGGRDSAYINLSHLPELTNEKLGQEFIHFKEVYTGYLLNDAAEEELLRLVVQNQHGLRWLEKVTSNLIRENYLSNTDEKTRNTNTANPAIYALNEIFQATINCNKLIKSYTQANRQYACEQLVMKINNIIRPLV